MERHGTPRNSRDRKLLPRGYLWRAALAVSFGDSDVQLRRRIGRQRVSFRSVVA